ncbi:MAG: putative membrane protein YqjE [Psychromonas sp.]|jgi:uncharacterized membrane protein YqjE|uniref:phage holin family protein n=1 Tax=Psychromonas sp. TaxID=1884585 RepID=UPI0039E57FFE
MIENSESASAGDKAEKSEQLEDLQLWASWLQQAATISTDIFQLVQLELRLAISDSKRLLVLALLFVPILILSWISFTVLLAWLVYQINSSTTCGLLAFFVCQILALLAIFWGWGHYKKSLSLPLTREHIQQFTAGKNHDS